MSRRLFAAARSLGFSIMLANVWPEVQKHLLKRTNQTQAQFAKAAGISQKSPTRYAQRENAVGRNFAKIAKGFGLTSGQLGYVYARFLLRHYWPFRFELEIEEESEIREPAATYDPPTARERAQALLRLDTRQVPPDLAPPLALMRKELKELLEEHDAAIKDLESRLLRLVELYEQMFRASMDVWKRMKPASAP